MKPTIFTHGAGFPEKIKEGGQSNQGSQPPPLSKRRLSPKQSRPPIKQHLFSTEEGQRAGSLGFPKKTLPVVQQATMNKKNLNGIHMGGWGAWARPSGSSGGSEGLPGQKPHPAHVGPHPRSRPRHKDTQPGAPLQTGERAFARNSISQHCALGLGVSDYEE